jgi:hypothetical protein
MVTGAAGVSRSGWRAIPENGNVQSGVDEKKNGGQNTRPASR